MKLSTKGDYATRALLELSLLEGPRALSVHELSERTRISPKYLEQIMMRLRTANIVRSHRGINGGYELARPSRDITVGEVVRLMDGPLAPSACASACALPSVPLPHGGRLRAPWPLGQRARGDR